MSENIGNDIAPAKDAPSSNNTSYIAEHDVGSAATQNTTHNGEPSTQASITVGMASQGPPPLEMLARQSIRTHRHWTPKYGRVQKCDWCNGRSAGTLQVCSTCSLRMCEDCARNRMWHTNRSHFIDADTCDWDFRKLAKPVSKRGSKRPAPPSPDEEPRRKVSRTAKSRDGLDGDDDSADDDNGSFRNPGPGRGQLPVPASARHDAGRPIRRPPANPDGHWQDALPYRQATVPRDSAPPATTEPELTVASNRPHLRQATAKALSALNELARRSSRGTPDEDGDDEQDEDYEDEDEDRDGDVYEEKGFAKKENDPLRRRGNYAAQITAGRPLSRARSEVEHTSSPMVLAPGRLPLAHPPAHTAEDIEHDRIILDVYDWVYGDRPSLDPRRVRTQIPDHWAGDWQGSAYRYGHESSPYGYNSYPPSQYPPPGYGQFPAHMPPPLPPSYAPYPAHHHPEYSYNNNPGYGPGPGGPYIRTARHNPTYQPYNEHTTAEVDHARQDRQTLDEMVNAWTHNPLLLRLVADNRRVYAIGLLWDVLEVRRARVFLRDDSQTVRWFVTERDRQFRLQHSAPAYYAQGPARAVTPGLLARGPSPVGLRGYTPAGARLPTPGGQTPWAGMGGHRGHAESGAARHRGESAGVDDRSENGTVVPVDNGDKEKSRILTHSLANDHPCGTNSPRQAGPISDFAGFWQ